MPSLLWGGIFLFPRFEAFRFSFLKIADVSDNWTSVFNFTTQHTTLPCTPRGKGALLDSDLEKPCHSVWKRRPHAPLAAALMSLGKRSLTVAAAVLMLEDDDEDSIVSRDDGEDEEVRYPTAKRTRRVYPSGKYCRSQWWSMMYSEDQKDHTSRAACFADASGFRMPSSSI